MACALTSHLVSGTPELQFAIDELPTSECVATVVHVVQSEPSAADRGLEVLAALADDEAKYWREPPGLELALGRLLDHVASYEGRPPPADGRAQLAAVERLLARCATAPPSSGASSTRTPPRRAATPRPPSGSSTPSSSCTCTSGC